MAKSPVIGLLAAVLAISLADSAFGSEECKLNATQTHQVCFVWQRPTKPVEDTDFTANYDCIGCDLAPKVVLKTGDPNWEVYAIVPSLDVVPVRADIGELRVQGYEDFTVTFTMGGVEGADNIGLIDLRPDGDHFGSLADGSAILGDVTGDVIAPPTIAGVGGVVNLDVPGSLTGNVDCREITSLNVGTGVAGGDLTGTILAQTIVSLIVNGDLNTNLTNVNDLTGELTVTGGIQSVVFSNDVSGDITLGRIPAGATLQIDGTASGDITILGDIEYDSGTSAKGTVHIGTFTGVVFNILGDVDGDFTIGTLRDAGHETTFDLDFRGATGANAVITIGEFQNDAWVQFEHNTAIFLGKLCLPTGIPNAGVEAFGAKVQWYGPMNGDVDLGGADVDGLLNLDAGGSGDILNGGDVGVAGWVIVAGNASPVAFTGMATFGDVSGVIQAWAHDHDGTLTVDSITATGSIEIGRPGVSLNLGGTIHVTNAGAATGAVAAGGEIVVFGNLEPGGKIEVDGPMKGSITAKGLASGSVLIDDKLEGGTLTFEGNATSTAYVRINNMTSAGMTHSLVDMQGIFDGDMLLDSGIPENQTVQIVGALDLHGEIDLSAGALAGTLSFDDDANGDISIGGNLDAQINIQGSLDGDVTVSGDANFGVDIGKSLKGKGRILINGLLAGDVAIQEGSIGGSVIRATDGLSATGSVSVNKGRGPHDAGGSMYFGDASSMLPGPTTFDGNVLVKDCDQAVHAECSPTNTHGLLLGGLTVRGCHATNDDLDICICGTGFQLDPLILQGGCTNQVVDSCVSGCP